MPSHPQSSGERQRPEPPPPTGSGERQQPDFPARTLKSHLPRLASGYYRGHTFVHWTLTLEHRATGWLTPSFHGTWRHVLLHACARYHLACPCYVLMPDHIHLLAAGVTPGADQRLAIEFLRRHIAPAIAPAKWQKQAHDHVLREEERAEGALPVVARYILENPVRAGLVERWENYTYTGCCVAGYPELDPRMDDYWMRFWRVYNHLVGSA